MLGSTLELSVESASAVQVEAGFAAHTLASSGAVVGLGKAAG